MSCKPSLELKVFLKGELIYQFANLLPTGNKTPGYIIETQTKLFVKSSLYLTNYLIIL